jgi:hypothetical protein
VLPGTKRVFPTDWNNGFPHYENVVEDGKTKTKPNGQPIRHLVWDIKQLGKIRIGKYTARVLVVYDDGKRDVPVEGYVSFWVIPWRIIAVLLVIIGLMVGGAYIMLRGAWKGARRLGRRK